MLNAHFTTSEGNFTVRLFEEEVPNTVANFVGLAEGTKEWTDPKSGQKVKRPFYDGLIFHRVIDGFMIQGGDPLGTGTGGPGYKFADEFSPKLRHSKAASCRWRTRGRTRTAASSSSRSRRRRGSTTSTASSARSSTAWTSCEKIGKTPTSKPGDTAAQADHDSERQDQSIVGSQESGVEGKRRVGSQSSPVDSRLLTLPTTDSRLLTTDTVNPAADERVVADAREQVDSRQRVEDGLASRRRQAGVARRGREVYFVSRGHRLQQGLEPIPTRLHDL